MFAHTLRRCLCICVHLNLKCLTQGPFIFNVSNLKYSCVFKAESPCVSGQHRSLGPSISKVRSLKLDSSIWSNELVEVAVITNATNWSKLFLPVCDSPVYPRAPHSSSWRWGTRTPTAFGRLISRRRRSSTAALRLSSEPPSFAESTGRGSTAGFWRTLMTWSSSTRYEFNKDSRAKVKKLWKKDLEQDKW